MKQHKATHRFIRHTYKFFYNELKFLRTIVYTTIIRGILLAFVGGLCGVCYTIYFVATEPSYTIYDLPLAEPSKVLDRHGIELYKFVEEDRVTVSYKEISPKMITSIVSIEDKDFWTNDGFNILAIIRSISTIGLNRRETGEIDGPGGSTLTQQVIKNAIVGKKRTAYRKITELLHARLLTYNSYARNKSILPELGENIIWEQTKQDIVSYYLNKSFFGNKGYGVYKAADIYFNTKPQDLTWGQSAVLAGIVRSPYRFNPYTNPDLILGYRSLVIDGKETKLLPGTTEYNRISSTVIKKEIYPLPGTGMTIDETLPVWSGTNKNNDQWSIQYIAGRKDQVIQRLYEDQALSLKEAIKSILSPLGLQKPKTNNILYAPHFVEYVKSQLLDSNTIGISEQQLYQGGYTITTTLDIKLQQQLESINKSFSKQALSFGAQNRSFLITNMHHGDILSYIGSLDYYNIDIQGQVDMIRSPRQVGSTIKPLTYAFAMMLYPLGIDTSIRDVRTNFGGFSPSNADKATKGTIKLKNALAGSRNIPAVKVVNMIGIKTTQSLLQKIGMTSLSKKNDFGLSLSLGVGEVSMLELAQSYMEMSDQKKVPIVHSISSISNKQGEIIYNQKDHNYKGRTIPLGVAKLISYILSQKNFAPQYFQAMITVPQCSNCASKTGTTNMKSKGINKARDAWIVTYNPDLLITIWAGNTNASHMKDQAYGFTINRDIRDSIMTLLVKYGYTSANVGWNFPKNETKTHKGQGEGYRYTTYPTFKKSML